MFARMTDGKIYLVLMDNDKYLFEARATEKGLNETDIVKMTETLEEQGDDYFEAYFGFPKPKTEKHGKFIRTEDNVVFEGPIDNIGTYKVTNFYSWKKLKPLFTQWKIIKEADTLEALCDCLIGKKENRLPVVANMPKNEIDDDETITRFVKDCEKTLKIDGYEVYAGIWTEKGLVYIAKLNEKGELELL